MIYQQINDGVIIAVKVIPKANQTAIIGLENEELKIRLVAIPEKGKANKTLTDFIASLLHISKSSVKVIQGEKSRHKKVFIANKTYQEIIPILESKYK